MLYDSLIELQKPVVLGRRNSKELLPSRSSGQLPLEASKSVDLHEAPVRDQDMQGKPRKKPALDMRTPESY